MKIENLDSAINKSKNILEGFEREFFERIWATDLAVYESRLKAINFEGLGKVLDAGFGNGQWTISLCNLNRNVSAIEYSPSRVKVLNEFKNELEISNLDVSEGNIEEMHYPNDSFDAIFSYSVIYFTDYRKTFSEFYRILKPGGKLYFSANSIGWYLYCLVEQHNKSLFYDPRQMAADAISHTLNYYLNNKHDRGNQLVLDPIYLKKELEILGFTDILYGSEGSLNFKNASHSLSFYKYEKYLDKDFIFEIYAQKR